MTWSSRSSNPRWCSAETGNKCSKPKLWNSCVRDSRFGLSILFTATETGLPRRCSMRARSRSTPVISARPSIRKMTWSAVLSATWACFRISAGIISSSLGMMPPVSISSNFAAAVGGFAVDAVAGDAGLVAHDRAALADDGVEESGLADIGPADDDDGGEGGHCFYHRLDWAESRDFEANWYRGAETMTRKYSLVIEGEPGGYSAYVPEASDHSGRRADRGRSHHACSRGHPRLRGERAHGAVSDFDVA